MAREIGIGPRFYGVPFYPGSARPQSAADKKEINTNEEVETEVALEEVWAAKSTDGHSIPWPTA